MPRAKIYCGTAGQLPPGYDIRGNRFQCMKKGYGSCLAAGKDGTKSHEHQAMNANAPKIYCGTDVMLPNGYTRFGNLSECLRKGYGACLYTPRRPYTPIPDAWCESFYQEFKNDEFTRGLWLHITATLTDDEWSSVQEYLKLVEMPSKPGIYKIRKRQ